VKHHLGLGIILLSKTNGVLEPAGVVLKGMHMALSSPSSLPLPSLSPSLLPLPSPSSLPKSSLLLPSPSLSLPSSSLSLLSCGTETTFLAVGGEPPPMPLVGPPPQPHRPLSASLDFAVGWRQAFVVVEAVLVAGGSHGGGCRHRSSGGFLLGK
jgi:hypothetical protein